MYIYAIHGDNDLTYDGYLVLTRAIGADPSDRNGENFRRFGHECIVRLNYGYGDEGTIPAPNKYADFAQRVAHYVKASLGCHRWIIGNEPNVAWERPGGQPITPAQYAECYTLCRDAIHALQFHNADQVLVAPIGPWNVDTEYPGNPSGDWVRYFDDVQYELGVNGCDGFALHTYVREQHPRSVVSPARMDAPFEHYHSDFRTYWDWMAAILPRFQGLPCYITEMCVAGKPWENINTGVVRAAYDEIDGWNALRPDRPIHCLALYRWQFDQWELWNKLEVHEDFYDAVAQGYTWPQTTEPPEESMLRNPSFEGEWYNQGAAELRLPVGWAAEFQEGNDPYKRPEIQPNQEFSTDGDYSIRAFPPAHSRGFYGIYQDVDAQPGQWYRFSADVRAESEPPGKLGVFVGIQPWGGSVFHRQMIWGKEIVNSQPWTRLEVYAQAFGGRIRVAMGADNEFATRNNTTWWDNAQLELWDCDGGTPPVEPPEPGECAYNEDRLVERIADAVRYELDNTRLGPNE